MKCVPSPNFNARAANIALEYIVLHYTGMRSAAEAQARLCDPAAEVSAHYMIDEDGSITRLVDEKHRAWHAGRSFWRGIADVNSASVGIEMVNPGHECGYRAFPAAQIQALQSLLHDIIARHSMNPATCLLAHSDIAPARKTDPGELFPWAKLAQDGLGLWPQPEDSGEGDATALLAAIGYDVTDPVAALTAFQRRFYPEHMTGTADTGTVARLRAVKRVLG